MVRGRTYDTGVIEHFWCAPYVEQLATVCKHTIIDLHNVESELHSSCAQSLSWPMSSAHRRFQRSCLREEQYWLPRFGRLLVTSDEDAAPGATGESRSSSDCIPECIAHGVCSCDPGATGHRILGKFRIPPEHSGVQYFVKEIWPRLATEFPRLKLRLIGKNPGAVTRYISGVAGIETTGPVEDAIRELAKVEVAVVPLISGSGTRLKILEAWAAARPVVSTTLGAEGLGARHGIDIVLADTPDAFVASVTRLLGSKEERLRIGCAARHNFEEGFTWETAWKSLDGDGLGNLDITSRLDFAEGFGIPRH